MVRSSCRSNEASAHSPPYVATSCGAAKSPKSGARSNGTSQNLRAAERNFLASSIASPAAARSLAATDPASAAASGAAVCSAFCT